MHCLNILVRGNDGGSGSGSGGELRAEYDDEDVSDGSGGNRLEDRGQLQR